MGFGLVCKADGTKFSTRDGECVKLNDLLDEAKNRALA
jgi:arginyl-tRNA synthetase